MTPRFPARSRYWAALLLLGGTAACVGQMGRARDPFSAPATDEEGGRIRVEVQNLNFNDATIYAVRGGQEIRIGRITGKSDERYNIDWTFAQLLQFRVDLVGGRRCRTVRIQADPGDQLWLQIPSNVGVSQCRLAKR